jgi:CMP-N-acetylneuraminic acid synthetase
MRLFCGQPLIYWTIKAAQESNCFSKIVVTSDNPGILGFADGMGVIPLARPEKLSQGEKGSSVNTVLHVLDNYDCEEFMLLQPTSPLRTVDDILYTTEICMTHYYDFAVSVYRADDITFRVNGAIYLCNAESFRKHKEFYNDDSYLYVMPKERSIDIDTEDDWQEAEKLMRARLCIES